MFKKKRNALIEEMWAMVAAERRALIAGLLDAGLIESFEEERKWGALGPAVTKYVFTTGLVSREQVKKDADLAAQRAVRDQVQKERVQANAKIRQDMEERKLERKIAKGADAAINAYLEHAAATARGAVDRSAGSGFGVPCEDVVDPVERGLDHRHVAVECPLEVFKVGGFVDVRVDCGNCFANFGDAHSVSPLRSGLCGGAQSSPTLTVAETGCACQGAASGAGVSSAAPASQTSEGGAA